MDRDQIDLVAGMLARAFDDDPIWSTLWPDAGRRAAQLQRMFAALARTSMAAGGHATTLGGQRGAALWLPPGRGMRISAVVRSRFAMPRMMLRMSRGEARSLLAMVTLLDRRHAALVPEPHWYLWVVGVEPHLHGQGLGTLLVRDGLARADRDGTPVYLETETAGNVGYYEGLGFMVVEELVAPGIGVPLWLMVHRPS
jgi:ribosomal protein S18 acetylase RimI-like enzyme